VLGAYSRVLRGREAMSVQSRGSENCVQQESVRTLCATRNMIHRTAGGKNIPVASLLIASNTQRWDQRRGLN
jgi:hypothetical protein